MCGLARLAFPTLLSGLIVASLTGSPALGWLAAAVVAGAFYLVSRRWLAGGCGVPQPTARPFEGLARAGEDRAAAPGVEATTAQAQASGDLPARGPGC